MEFEFLKAADDAGGLYVTPRLYTIEGRGGILRRVKRTTRGLQPPKNGVLALFDGSVIELIRDPRIEEEIVIAAQQPGDSIVIFGPGDRYREVPAENFPCPTKCELDDPFTRIQPTDSVEILPPKTEGVGSSATPRDESSSSPTPSPEGETKPRKKPRS